MKRILGILLIVVLLSGLALQSCGKSEGKAKREASSSSSTAVPHTEGPAGISQGPKAPDFLLYDKDGNAVQLSDFSGKVVILDFWATWCGPCRMEIPGFVQLYERYKDEGLEIVGISLDRDGWNAVIPFMEQYGVNYTVVLGDQNVVMRYGGIRSIPTTFVINKNGQVVDRVVGYRPPDYFENEVVQLLNE